MTARTRRARPKNANGAALVSPSRGRVSTKRQPIPRYANGYFFRSTLELAWACFFDRLGVHWKYENYNVNGIWLPDFVLELSSLLYVFRKSFTFSIEELKSVNVLKRHCSTILVEVKPACNYVG